MQRRRLFGGLMGSVAAIDLELRSLPRMDDVLQEAARLGVTAIVSFHDFRRTPPLQTLRTLLDRAERAGADVVKVATHLRGVRDLSVLLELQAGARRDLATMGMGPLGKVSRLALGAAGSRLNYGYLDKPRVEGQWPAVRLAGLLREVAP
jgi:3-dehydroquinate dehydratase-1